MPLLYVATGIAAGVLSGLFGIGGGLIIVVALTSVGGMTQRMANGTSLATLLLPVSFLAVLQYWRDQSVDIAAAAWIAGGLVFGAWLGGRFAHGLSNLTLQRGFAVFLLLMALRMWFKAS